MPTNNTNTCEAIKACDGLPCTSRAYYTVAGRRACGRHRAASTVFVDLRGFGGEHVQGSFVIESLTLRRWQHGAEVLADIVLVRVSEVATSIIRRDLPPTVWEVDPRYRSF